MSGTQADEERTAFYTTATVRAAATDEASVAGLLALIKKKAPDPSIFEEGLQPFTWSAEVSSTRLDSYFTRQDIPSLRNYAKDASDGVMFLDSHDHRQLGFGQSIRGTFTAAPGGKPDEKVPDDGDPATVLVDFFTVPGVQLGRASSDSFITSVRSGVIKDVSIGFMPDRFECNLCGNDPFDWWSMDCMHVPGAYYDSTGKHVVTKRSDGAVQCFAWVRDSRLLEVSAVYDGAAPGAYIKKAQWLAEAGEVDRAAATIIERQLRIKLPAQAMSVPVLKVERVGKTDKLIVARGTAIIDGVTYSDGAEVDPMRFRRLAEERAQDDPASTAQQEDTGEQQPSPPTENQNLKREESREGVADSSGGITSPAHAAPEDLRMSGEHESRIRELEQRVATVEPLIAQVRAALAAAGVKDAETVDPATAIRELHATITDLKPRAQMGDEWRADVVKRALESGVRAMANDFKSDEWEQTFRSMPVSQIQLLAASWERQAPDLSGGRRTADIGTNPPAGGGQKASETAPAAQYAVNGRR